MSAYLREQGKLAAARGRPSVAGALRAGLAGALLLAAGGCGPVSGAVYNLANPWQDEGPPIPDYVIDSGVHMRPMGWLDEERLVLAAPVASPQRLVVWRPFADPAAQDLEPVALKPELGPNEEFWRLRCLQDGWIRYPAGRLFDAELGRAASHHWWGRVDGEHRLIRVELTEAERIGLAESEVDCGLEPLPVDALPAPLRERTYDLEPLPVDSTYLMTFDMSTVGLPRRIALGDRLVLGLPEGVDRLDGPDEHNFAKWLNRYFFEYPPFVQFGPSGAFYVERRTGCAAIEEVTTDLRVARRFCLPETPSVFPWQVARGGFVTKLDAGYYREPGSQYEAGLLYSDMDGNVRKILGGHILNFVFPSRSRIVSVSPGGCRVAVLHSPTTESVYFRLEADPDWPRDDTAKVIDLCAAAEPIAALPFVEVTSP